MANIIKTGRTTSPWRDFLNVDDFFDRGLLNKWQKEFPAVNISEDEKVYGIEVVAPGFRKDDFKVKVDDDILTISAESKFEKQEPGNGKEYTRREYGYNSFTRSFRLPENVKDDSISASYQDGILKLELPKSKVQVKATKEITIK
jgi:HSP20 family protein